MKTKIAYFLYLAVAHGFRSHVSQPRCRSVFLSPAKIYASSSSTSRYDEDSSMVAAASAASLCSISGDDPVLRSWCEEAMKLEIPQLFEGESEYDLPNDETDEGKFVLKSYNEEETSELDDNDESLEDDDLCAFGKALDIDVATSTTDATSIKRLLHPKKRKHLFRYSPDISVSCWLSTVEPKELLLSCGYSTQDVERMFKEYPKLLTASPKDFLAPKLRFLVKVLGGGTGDIGNGLTFDEQDEDNFIPHNLQVSEVARNKEVPTHAFFSPRLETALAPRHAYLAFHGDTLPFGNELLHLKSSNDANMSLLDEFLRACVKSPKEFAALCQKWEAENISNRSAKATKIHSADSVTAMDNIFADGIVPFARNQVTLDLEMLGKKCTPSDAFALLLDHGSNYAEHDDWGSTILHWTAGTGNLDAMKLLIERLEQDEKDFGGDARDVLWSTCASCSMTRDGATPLHWAACGVSNTKFGCGGHEDVCRYLLGKAGERKQELVNTVTSSGNSPLMWACWSGSIEVAKLLVSSGADLQLRNDKGVGVAHWAACSGNLTICKYLHDMGFEFQGPETKDHDGKTPLDVALSFGHADIVEWITRLTHELTEDVALQQEKLIEEAN